MRPSPLGWARASKTRNNKTDVYNQTSNRYGISGYLNEKDVARHIFTGLTS
jgi:hypothetical protein